MHRFERETLFCEGDGGQLLPLVRSFDGEDRFEALFQAWANCAHTARLQGGWDVRGMGRYSILGVDPYQVMTAMGEQIVHRSSQGVRESQGDPFLYLDAEYQRLRARRTAPGVEAPFQGGAIGYLGYGLRHFVERVPARLTADLPLPDLYFAFYDVACVYDHLNDRGYLFSTGLPKEGHEAEERARQRLDEVWEWMHSAPTPRLALARSQTVEDSSLFGNLHASMTKPEYIQAVAQAKEYIRTGDIYQVNLSQRFDVAAPFAADTLFSVLRRVNPCPFGAYLHHGEWSVLSVSPERFFHFDGTHVETRPIKGTRPRGKGADEDERFRRELELSKKDQAEHVMIVDLERNDLGRFCRYGSVVVPQLMGCEAHPTVWHMVSIVRGQLRDGESPIEAVRSAFPGGSITGAPKVRSMEIIDELERVSRGVYTGSIGYLSAGGAIDLNIAIRTLSLTDERAYFHVGGAIVADSDPDEEYQETLDKGLGIARALAIAAQEHSAPEKGET